MSHENRPLLAARSPSPPSLFAAPRAGAGGQPVEDELQGIPATGKDGDHDLWAWLYGYYADQDADPVIDFGKLTAKGQALAEACQKSPDKDIISIAEDIYEK